MIRVAKGKRPDVLRTKGVAKAAEHRRDFDKDPQAYLNGTKKLSISKAIYGHQAVLEALRDAQHGKCCYCEVKIETPYMDEHVEHWRPKGSVKQRHGEPEFTPGYYWLAYVWDNLFLSCQVCNRNHKGTQFPVADPANRARDHHQRQAFAAEQPEMLKPDGPEDPETAILWREDVPREGTPRGRVTIEIAGLVRDLDPKRGQVLTELRYALERLRKYGTEASPIVQEEMDRHRAALRSAREPAAPFSAMAKAFLAAAQPWEHL
jgi:uncharacterized protein (TIGR02646 family)